MTESVKKIYYEAKANETFLNELKLAEAEEWKRPKWWWNSNRKIVFAAVYYGWLIANGLYKKENYES